MTQSLSLAITLFVLITSPLSRAHVQLFVATSTNFGPTTANFRAALLTGRCSASALYLHGCSTSVKI